MATKKKKLALTSVQFTFKGVLYKKGAEFKGKRNEVKSLIDKNIIKWQ